MDKKINISLKSLCFLLALAIGQPLLGMQIKEMDPTAPWDMIPIDCFMNEIAQFSVGSTEADNDQLAWLVRINYNVRDFCQTNAQGITNIDRALSIAAATGQLAAFDFLLTPFPGMASELDQPLNIAGIRNDQFMVLYITSLQQEVTRVTADQGAGNTLVSAANWGDDISLTAVAIEWEEIMLNEKLKEAFIAAATNGHKNTILILKKIFGNRTNGFARAALRASTLAGQPKVTKLLYRLYPFLKENCSIM